MGAAAAPIGSDKASSLGEGAGAAAEQGNATTRRLTLINLALRGIEAGLAVECAETDHRN